MARCDRCVRASDCNLFLVANVPAQYCILPTFRNEVISVASNSVLDVITGCSTHIQHHVGHTVSKEYQKVCVLDRQLS